MTASDTDTDSGFKLGPGLKDYMVRDDGGLTQGEPPPVEQCDKCRFWDPKGGLFPLGFCRRYPPAVDLNQRWTDAVYPSVKPVGWCGEFKSRKVHEAIANRRHPSAERHGDFS